LVAAAALAASLAPAAHAGILASFDFTGVDKVNSVSATGLGSGITAASIAAAGPYLNHNTNFVNNDFSCDSTSSSDTTDLATAIARKQYFALDITGSDPYSIDSIDTSDMVSQNHARDWYILSSADGYVSTLAMFSTPSYLSGTQHVALNLNGLSGTTELRLYVVGVNSYQAVGFYTNPHQLVVNGSAGAVPEPASLGLLGLGALALLGRRR
jgi:hypothetical protein